MSTLRRSLTERTWSPFQIGWLAILVVTVTVRLSMTSSMSWLADDLLFSSLVPTMGFREYVLQDLAAHVFPGNLLYAWILTTLDPLDYTWAIVSTLVLSCAIVVGWGLALRGIFGERVHTLFALVVLTLSPTMTVVSLWWSSSMNTFPFLASMGFSTWFLARYILKGEGRGDLAGMTVSYALGLFFLEKSLLITVLLFFLCLLMGPPAVRDALRLAVRALWPVTLVSVAYLAFYAWSVHGGDDPPTPAAERGVSQAAASAAHGTADIVLPALLGGPFTTVETAISPFAQTPSAVTYLLWAAAVILVIIGLQHRRRGGVAVLMLLTYASLSWGVWFLSDRFALFGPANLQTGRYSADIVPVALLACLFLVTPVVGETNPLRRPVSAAIRMTIRRGLVVYLVVVSVTALVMTGRMWDRVEPTSSKPFMDNLLNDARDIGRATVYDTPPPQTLVNTTFLAPAGRISLILAPLELPLSYNNPTEQFVVTAGDGHLRNAAVVGGVENLGPPPTENCGYAVAPGEVTKIPLNGDLFDYEWVMELSYFSGSDARISVRTDDDQVDLDVPATAAGDIGRRQLPIAGEVRSLSIEGLRGDQTVCVTGLRIGLVEATDEVPEKLAD